jgi:hypothetical protein
VVDVIFCSGLWVYLRGDITSHWEDKLSWFFFLLLAWLGLCSHELTIRNVAAHERRRRYGVFLPKQSDQTRRQAIAKEGWNKSRAALLPVALSFHFMLTLVSSLLRTEANILGPCSTCPKRTWYHFRSHRECNTKHAHHKSTAINPHRQV